MCITWKFLYVLVLLCQLADSKRPKDPRQKPPRPPTHYLDLEKQTNNHHYHHQKKKNKKQANKTKKTGSERQILPRSFIYLYFLWPAGKVTSLQEQFCDWHFSDKSDCRITYAWDMVSGVHFSFLMHLPCNVASFS